MRYKSIDMILYTKQLSRRRIYFVLPFLTYIKIIPNEIVAVAIINPINHWNPRKLTISHPIIAANPPTMSCIPSRSHRSKSLLFWSVCSESSLSKIGFAIAFPIATKICVINSIVVLDTARYITIHNNHIAHPTTSIIV